jgi:hypothetical protein
MAPGYINTGRLWIHFLITDDQGGESSPPAATSQARRDFFAGENSPPSGIDGQPEPYPDDDTSLGIEPEPEPNRTLALMAPPVVDKPHVAAMGKAGLLR